MIYSYDVFDTVLARACGHPFGIFVEMAHQLPSRFPGLPPDTASLFPALRVKAEHNARSEATGEEVCVDAIYRELARLMPDLGEAVQALCEFEVETELRAARPVPEIVADIRALERNGERVIFISDFYHSADTVAKMIEAIGIPVETGRLYVSSHYGVTKASGNLFRHVMSAEGCAPSALLHTGDNVVSDVRNAQKLGIKTRHFKRAHLGRHELAFSNPEFLAPTQRTLHQIGGSARLARLDQRIPAARELILSEIGACVAAPVLVPFVSWILSRAIASGVEKLFFIARDGQILHQIADNLISRSGLKLQTAYLYGSRQAWHLPAIQRLDKREMAWILNLDRDTSFRSLAKRLELDALEFCRLIGAFLPEVPTPQTRVHESDLVAIAAGLRGSALSRMIFASRDRSRAGMLKYLQGTGLLEARSVGIVDIGWHGNLQTSLVTVLESLKTPPAVTGWYLGLREGHAYTRRDLHMESFLFGPKRPEYAAALMQHSGFFEIFCAADHGGTAGYIDTPTGTQPLLNPDGGRDKLAWGLADMRRGILAFAEHFTASVNEDDIPAYIDTAISLIDAFVREPDAGEAEALGSFPFSTDQNDASITEFAPVVRLAGKQRGLRNLYSHDVWLAGALNRSNPLVTLVNAMFARNREIFLHSMRRILGKPGGRIGMRIAANQSENRHGEIRPLARL